MKKSAVTFSQLFPIILSLLVLGAHFVRSGPLLLTAFCFLLIAGLFFRKPITARLVQLALFLGTIEWILTASNLAAYRSMAGEPSTRMVIILGSVAALTFLCIFVFTTKTMKERYGLSVRNQSSDPVPTSE